MDKKVRLWKVTLNPPKVRRKEARGRVTTKGKFVCESKRQPFVISMRPPEKAEVRRGLTPIFSNIFTMKGISPVFSQTSRKRLKIVI